MAKTSINKKAPFIRKLDLKVETRKLLYLEQLCTVLKLGHFGK